MAFQPGQSGNPGGKHKLQVLTNELRKQLAQRPERLRSIVDKLISEAEEGNLTATNMILDRIEGKPLQTVETVSTVIVDRQERINRIAQVFSRASAVDIELTAIPGPTQNDE